MGGTSHYVLGVGLRACGLRLAALCTGATTYVKGCQLLETTMIRGLAELREGFKLQGLRGYITSPLPLYAYH
jgi:hypothetical protein